MLQNLHAYFADVKKYVSPATATTPDTYGGLGKTFPGATTPLGLVQVSPNTITGADNGSGYSYEHTIIEGFAFSESGKFFYMSRLLLMIFLGCFTYHFILELQKYFELHIVVARCYLFFLWER